MTDTLLAVLYQSGCSLGACRLWAFLWTTNGEQPGPLPLRSYAAIADEARAVWPCTTRQVSAAVRDLAAHGLLRVHPCGNLVNLSLSAIKTPDEIRTVRNKFRPVPNQYRTIRDQNGSTQDQICINANTGPAKPCGEKDVTGHHNNINKNKLQLTKKKDLFTNSEMLNAAEWRAFVPVNDSFHQIRDQVKSVLWVSDLRRDVIDRATAAVCLKLTGANKSEYLAIYRNAINAQGEKPPWAVVNLAICRIYEGAGWSYPGTLPGVEPRPAPLLSYVSDNVLKIL